MKKTLSKKMLFKKPFGMALLFLLFSTTFAFSQVTGVVTDDQNQGLPGVTIAIKNTNKGTVTDANGKYSLAVAGDQTLVISFIGFIKQEIAVGGRSVVNVKLETDSRELEDVVVIGYGTVRRKDLVGAVGSVKSKEFGSVVATDAKQLIQGKLAGVQVVNSGGLPGQGAKIFIRGTGSFTNSDPLYLIDGLPGDINSVAPQDIEDITVLKDAASVAIYGAKAANGVVVVTTKQGKAGTMKVTYNGWVGTSKEWKRLDLLNADQYIDLVKEIAPNTTAPAIIDPANRTTRTDWQDQIFQRGKSTEHYLNMAGGSDKLVYSVSMGYSNQTAHMQNFNYQRVNFRVNLAENISKRIRIGQALNIRHTITNGVTGSFIEAIRMPPYAPVLDPTQLGGYSNIRPTIDLQDGENPQAVINNRESINRGTGTTLQVFGELDLIKGLKFRTQASVEGGVYSGYTYSKAFASANKIYERTLSEYVNSGLYNPLIENFLTYSKDAGKHSVNVLVGNTYANGQRVHNLGASGSNFPSDELPFLAGAVDKPGAPGKAVTAFVRENDYNRRWSYFSRLQYGYSDKYLLTASLRQDYSPNFGKNFQSGIFPSVGFAWKMGNENFMKSIPAISDLKIRGSWGKTGNDNIGLFNNLVDVPTFAGYNPGAPTYSFGDAKDFNSGLTIASIGNADLKWEETTSTNLGVDASFLKNALTLNFDVYQRLNNDLLMRVNVAPSSGLGDVYNAANVPKNVAKAVNKGFETALTYRKTSGSFQYSVSGNVSYNKNEVTFMPLTNPIINSGGFEDVSATSRTQVGQPIGAYWGYRMAGVASTKAQIDALNEAAKTKIPTAKEYQAGLTPGDIIFKDLNGDGVLTDKDQEVLGSPMPTWMFGVTAGASFKNFDLNINASGLGDVYVVNGLTYNLEGTAKIFNGSTALLNRWKKEGDVSSIPKAGQNAKGTLNLRPSDRYVENASYLRFRDITLGYTIPSAALKSFTKNALSSTRLYITGQNMLTLTQYKGYDPEITGGIFSRGVDRGQIPQPRTIMVGLQLGF